MAVFPGGVVGFAQAQLHKTVNLAQTTLAGGIASGATSLVLTSAATLQTWPTANFVILNATKNEMAFCSSRTGTTCTIVKGVGGLGSSAWDNLDSLRVVLASEAIQVAFEEIAAIEAYLFAGGAGLNAADAETISGQWTFSSGIVTATIGPSAGQQHTLPASTSSTVALLSNKLSAFAATTSAELAGVITNETGSGSLVFATSPTLVTPDLGVASATSINKVAFTAPATASTLTIADGKTLTVSDTTILGTDAITFAGTEVLTLAATKSVTFADAFTTAGAFPITFTSTASTSVTLPLTGTLATLAGTESLSNKALVSPTVSGSWTVDGSGNVTATSFTGNGAGLTGIAGATGGVTNTGSTTIGADTDSDGIGVIALQTRGVTRVTVPNATDGFAFGASSDVSIARSGAGVFQLLGSAAGDMRFAMNTAGDPGFEIRAVAADANAAVFLNVTSGLRFGAGGATALDVQLSRGAANRLDLATGDSFRIVSGQLQFGSTVTFTGTDLSPGANFTLTQNSVAVITSVNASAVVNTLYLSAGNVGVGMVPVNTLDVGSAINTKISVTSTGSNKNVYFSGTPTGTGDLIIENTLATRDVLFSYGGLALGSEAVKFVGSGAVANTIVASAGKVGIGTATPGTLVGGATVSGTYAHVQGAGNAWLTASAQGAGSAGVFLENVAGTAGKRLFYIAHDGDNTIFRFANEATGGDVQAGLAISSAGLVTVPGTFGVSGTSTLTGNVGIGVAPSSQTALRLASTVTAVGGVAHGFYNDATLTAAANSDILAGLRTPSIFAKSTFISLEARGIWADGANMSQSGAGTIANAYSIYATAPTIGTNNYALYVPSGTTLLAGGGNGTLAIGASTAVGNQYIALEVGNATWVSTGVAAIGASGVFVRPSLRAGANSDPLNGILLRSIAFDKQSFTGLTGYGIKIDAANFTTSGAGTMPYVYGLHITAPNIAGTANFAAYFGGFVVQSLQTATPTTTELVANGEFAVTAASNTSLRFSYRGTDGTVRSGTLTIA